MSRWWFRRLSVASLFLAAGVVFLAGGPAVQAADEIALFNGKDLSGWTAVSTKPDVDVDDVWRAEDGVLHCDGRPTGYLRTTKPYTNYVLKLQWRWPPDSKPGNSGVLLAISGPDKVWPRCIEPQLAHGQAGKLLFLGGMKGGKRPPSAAGKISSESAEKPPGQWNEYELVVDHGTVISKVNGVLRGKRVGVEETAGYIGFQSEGAPIEFRDIRLTPIE